MSEPQFTSSEGDSISIRPFFEALWLHRRRIGLIWLGVVVAFAVGATFYYLTRPYVRTAQVQFRLIFEGADRGEYPNGTRFSRADLLAAPVLTQVYQANGLEQYLSYEQFKSSLFVFETNLAVDFLNLEYQAKLADRLLPAPTRAAMEAEYRQKLETLRIPQASLQFVLPSLTDSPPSLVMHKVLNDVLAQWAEQTASQRGALGYQIELLTPNVILKDTLNTQTMLIRYDLLRQHVSRIRAQVSRLSALPGANTTRIGPERLTLLDLQTNLEDLLQFQLNPLIRRRLIYALPPNEVALNMLYLEDRLIELQRYRDTSGKRRAQLENALQSFSSDSAGVNPSGVAPSTDAQAGVSTQLSDSFLDRLMDLAGRSNAMEYRTGLTDRILDAGEEELSVEEDIAFYQETLRLMRAAAAGSRPAALQPEDVATAFEGIQTRVVDILTLTNEAYKTVSEANLNPRSVLYRLTAPYSVQTLRTVDRGYLMMVGLVFLTVAFLVIAAGVAGAAVFRQSDFARGLRV